MVEKTVQHTLDSSILEKAIRSNILEKAIRRLEAGLYSQEERERMRSFIEHFKQSDPDLIRKGEEFMRQTGVSLDLMPEMCICLAHEYQIYRYGEIRVSVESLLFDR